MLKMKKIVWVAGVIWTIIVGLSSPVFATVIYNQSLSDLDNYGFISNIGGDLSADNFLVTTDSLLQSITWYGMYGSAEADTVDTFDIMLLDMSGTQLFGESFVSNIAKSYSGFNDVYGERIYQYQASISDWAVSVGSYLLSISITNSDSSDWYWADGLLETGLAIIGILILGLLKILVLTWRYPGRYTSWGACAGTFHFSAFSFRDVRGSRICS